MRLIGRLKAFEDGFIIKQNDNGSYDIKVGDREFNYEGIRSSNPGKVFFPGDSARIGFINGNPQLPFIVAGSDTQSGIYGNGSSFSARVTGSWDQGSANWGLDFGGMAETWWQTPQFESNTIWTSNTSISGYSAASTAFAFPPGGWININGVSICPFMAIDPSDSTKWVIVVHAVSIYGIQVWSTLLPGSSFYPGGFVPSVGARLGIIFHDPTTGNIIVTGWGRDSRRSLCWVLNGSGTVISTQIVDPFTVPGPVDLGKVLQQSSLVPSGLLSGWWDYNIVGRPPTTSPRGTTDGFIRLFNTGSPTVPQVWQVSPASLLPPGFSWQISMSSTLNPWYPLPVDPEGRWPVGKNDHGIYYAMVWVSGTLPLTSASNQWQIIDGTAWQSGAGTYGGSTLADQECTKICATVTALKITDGTTLWQYIIDPGDPSPQSDSVSIGLYESGFNALNICGAGHNFLPDTRGATVTVSYCGLIPDGYKDTGTSMMCGFASIGPPGMYPDGQVAFLYGYPAPESNFGAAGIAAWGREKTFQEDQSIYLANHYGPPLPGGFWAIAGRTSFSDANYTGSVSIYQCYYGGGLCGHSGFSVPSPPGVSLTFPHTPGDVSGIPTPRYKVYPKQSAPRLYPFNNMSSNEFNIYPSPVWPTSDHPSDIPSGVIDTENNGWIVYAIPDLYILGNGTYFVGPGSYSNVTGGIVPGLDPGSQSLSWSAHVSIGCFGNPESTASFFLVKIDNTGSELKKVEISNRLPYKVFGPLINGSSASAFSSINRAAYDQVYQILPRPSAKVVMLLRDWRDSFYDEGSLEQLPYPVIEIRDYTSLNVLSRISLWLDKSTFTDSFSRNWRVYNQYYSAIQPGRGANVPNSNGKPFVMFMQVLQNRITSQIWYNYVVLDFSTGTQNPNIGRWSGVNPHPTINPQYPNHQLDWDSLSWFGGVNGEGGYQSFVSGDLSNFGAWSEQIVRTY